MKNTVIETQLDSINKKIKEGIKNGAKIYYADQGNASLGMMCDCCGKTGIKLYGVMIVNKDEDPFEDPSQYVIGMFGLTCFKKSGIKAEKLM